VGGLSNMEKSNKLQIVIDVELQDLVPGYMTSVTKDLEILKKAVEASQFDNIETIGHRMKGVAVSYGFSRLSEIGKEIELAARDKNKKNIIDSTKKIQDYLDSIEIVYK
jgi:HPt (histidine-containing phosphotransfer) domain-containing protein